MTPLLLLSLALFAMLAEHAVAVRRGLRLYPWRETASNVGCGALRLGVSLATRGALLGAYVLVERRFGWLDLDASAPLTWVLAVVGFDFMYYWAHRASHRWPVLWAVHAVHHQPTRFNLALGLRAGALGPIASAPFFLALALVGVPAAVYATVAIAAGAIMFSQHAGFIRSLGPLEAVFNTPSHHRVHHAGEPASWDKNFGGLSIVWDRLFGTFRAESPVATAVRPLEPYPLSPLRANLAPWRALFARWRDARHRPPLGTVVRTAVVGATALTTALALAKSPLHPVALVALAAPALVLADLSSGVVHWWFDRHVPPGRGLLGRIAAEFAEHHERPHLAARATFVHSAAKSAGVALPLATVALVGPLPPVLAALAAWTAAIGFIAPELHKLAHRPAPNDFVRWLRARRLVLTPRAHARHHRGDHGRAYCVVTGWCNAALDGASVWTRLDHLVSRSARGHAPAHVNPWRRALRG